MVLLLGSKPFKRFLFSQVLTKAHETLPACSPPFSSPPSTVPARHTARPCCDSSTAAGSCVFIVASVWKALPPGGCRAHALISYKSSFKSQLGGQGGGAFLTSSHLLTFPTPFQACFSSLALIFSSNISHSYLLLLLFSDSPILAIISLRTESSRVFDE